MVKSNINVPPNGKIKVYKNKIMNKNDKIEIIKDKIIERGYDAWVTEEVLVISKNGFIKEFPIDNTLDLNSGIFPSSLDMIARLCIDKHKTAKDIKDGKYDNFVGMSTKEMFNKIFKK